MQTVDSNQKAKGLSASEVEAKIQEIKTASIARALEVGSAPPDAEPIRELYRQAGCNLVYIARHDKACRVTEWNHYSKTDYHEAQFAKFAPGCNAGIVVPAGWLVLDIDIKKGGQGAESFAQLCIDTGLELWNCISAYTASGGFHCYFYNVPGNLACKYNDSDLNQDTSTRPYPGIEVFAGFSDAKAKAEPEKIGSKFIAIPGSVVVSKKSYGDARPRAYTLAGQGNTIRNTPLPDKLAELFFKDETKLALADETDTAKRAKPKSPFAKVPSASKPQKAVSGAVEGEAIFGKADYTDIHPEATAYILSNLAKDTPDFNVDLEADWSFTGAMLLRSYEPETAFRLYDKWSSRSVEKYRQFSTVRKFTNLLKNNARTCQRKIGSLIHAAKKAGIYDAAIEHGRTFTAPTDGLIQGVDFKALLPSEQAEQLIARGQQEHDATDARPNSLASLCREQWFSVESSNKGKVMYCDLYPAGLNSFVLDEYAIARKWRDVCAFLSRGGKGSIVQPRFTEALALADQVYDSLSGIVIKPYEQEKLIKYGGGRYYNNYNHTELDKAKQIGARMLSEDAGHTATDAEWAKKCSDWLAFLEQHFVGLADGNADDGRAGFYWWLRAVQPRRRQRVALMLTGIEGLGKSVLADIAKIIVGERYYFPVDSDLLGGKFNDWQVGKLFIVGEELREVGESAKTVANKLKAFITNGNVSVEGKNAKPVPYLPEHSVLLISNDINPVHLSENDRRYLVLHATSTAPEFFERFGASAAEASGQKFESRADYNKYLHLPKWDSEFAKHLKAYIVTMDIRAGGKAGSWREFDSGFDEEFYSEEQAYRTKGFERVQPATQTEYDNLTKAVKQELAKGSPLANEVYHDFEFLYNAIAKRGDKLLPIVPNRPAESSLRNVLNKKMLSESMQFWRDDGRGGRSRGSKYRYVNKGALAKLSILKADELDAKFRQAYEHREADRASSEYGSVD